MNRTKKVLILCVMLAVSGLFAFSTSDKYFEIAKNMDIFATLFHEVNQNYVDEVSPTDLIKSGIDAMLKDLDPYTNYIPEDEIEDYRTMTTGEYGGIGIEVSNQNNRLVVTMPNQGYAAANAGVKIGDEILKINGIETFGRTPEEVHKLLKGQSGSQLELTIRRFGQPEPLNFTLDLERIQIDNVPYYGMVNDHIGMIQLSDFMRAASNEVREALDSLKEQGADQIILDLRGNPGGLLTEAINVSNVFLPKGLEIVSTKGKIKEWNRTHNALNNPDDTEIPIAVLINNRSASAAEIVSGVIQDYDRGVVIGQRSFGKGLVQQTRPLSYNSKLKVTVAKYYIPSGRCIQEIDYSRENTLGINEKVPDSLRVAFKTKNNRTVYDGGGIYPDIPVEQIKYAHITQALIQKGLIFDYATKFYYENPDLVKDARVFNFDDEQYKKFVQWLSTKSYDYTTTVEEALKQLANNSKEDSYFEALEDDIMALKGKMADLKQDDLQKFKPELMVILETEIASRYLLQKGRIESSFDDDPIVATAVTILEDMELYNQTLGVATKEKN